MGEGETLLIGGKEPLFPSFYRTTNSWIDCKEDTLRYVFLENLDCLNYFCQLVVKLWRQVPSTFPSGFIIQCRKWKTKHITTFWRGWKFQNGITVRSEIKLRWRFYCWTHVLLCLDVQKLLVNNLLAQDDLKKFPDFFWFCSQLRGVCMLEAVTCLVKPQK